MLGIKGYRYLWYQRLQIVGSDDGMQRALPNSIVGLPYVLIRYGVQLEFLIVLGS